MKIRHFLYNSFLIESGENKIAIDPGQFFSIFNFNSLIPKANWSSITHILITHGDPDHHWQSDRIAKASSAPVVCGIGMTRNENGQTLVIDPRGKELTSWVPIDNLHPLDIGDSIALVWRVLCRARGKAGRTHNGRDSVRQRRHEFLPYAFLSCNPTLIIEKGQQSGLFIVITNCY